MKKDEARKNRLGNLNELIMLSAWGAVLVVASFLFLFVGIRVDAAVGTGPFFISACHPGGFPGHGTLYFEFKKTNDRMGPFGGATPRTGTYEKGALTTSAAT